MVKLSLAKRDINALAGKLFAYEVKYDNPTDGSLNPPRYNGNISEVDWNTGGMGKKRYGYNYDGINRLLSARYRIPGVTLPQLGMYDEELGYDVNGNITTLKRS
ncbi:hypothetical protein, partial [Chryseobacterium sp. FH1]|uniref:hypothetical protein n=1 Tax=Chryseobacterium sp. FH1 TaxID=1233951 RepID=UPI000553D519